MNRNYFDVVWVWRAGGWEPERWSPTRRDELRARGEAAINGRKSIGPPDDPPWTSDYADGKAPRGTRRG